MHRAEPGPGRNADRTCHVGEALAWASVAVPFEDLRFQNEQEIFGIEELPVTW
jgi:hypothetical protein